MNRTLTAAVALAAGLGMAGMANAQGNATPANPPNPGMQAAPTTGMPSPSMTSPAPATAAPTPGMGAAASQPPAGIQANQASPGASQRSPAEASPATIQEAQQELKSQGLYNGPIDGIAGPETQTALSQFQQKEGLPSTAMLDQQTQDRLMHGGSAGTGSMPKTTSH